MKIHVEQLKSQCVLDEDIILNTEIPLIEKDTVLEDKHIDTLKNLELNILKSSRGWQIANLFSLKSFLKNN